MSLAMLKLCMGSSDAPPCIIFYFATSANES